MPGDTSTIEGRRSAVIENPHLVDWWFTRCAGISGSPLHSPCLLHSFPSTSTSPSCFLFPRRADLFVHKFLDDLLDCKWRWHRLEYQSRGSVHAHGTAKLANDPGLPMLTAKAHLKLGFNNSLPGSVAARIQNNLIRKNGNTGLRRAEGGSEARKPVSICYGRWG